MVSPSLVICGHSKKQRSSGLDISPICSCPGIGMGRVPWRHGNQSTWNVWDPVFILLFPLNMRFLDQIALNANFWAEVVKSMISVWHWKYGTGSHEWNNYLSVWSSAFNKRGQNKGIISRSMTSHKNRDSLTTEIMSSLICLSAHIGKMEAVVKSSSLWFVLTVFYPVEVNCGTLRAVSLFLFPQLLLQKWALQRCWLCSEEARWL